MIINLLDNTPNKPSKSRAKNWIEINDDTRGPYHTNSQIKFKNSMLKSSLCDYSDVYTIASGTMRHTAAGTNDNATRLDERNKGVKLI